MEILLEPELEAKIRAEAERQGKTVEELVCGVLREELIAKGQRPEESQETDSDKPKPKNLAEALGDFIGAVSSKDRFPEGSTLSQDTGRKFTEALLEDRRRKSS